MLQEDIRGHCNRNCVYNDNGRCDMWDDFTMPEDINTCNNSIVEEDDKW